MAVQSLRQWEHLAACADQGPCQFGFSYYMDIPNAEAEQRMKTTVNFVSAGFSFPLLPLVVYREQTRQISISFGGLDFVGTAPSNPGQAIVPDAPSRSVASDTPAALPAGGTKVPDFGGKADPPPFSQQQVPDQAVPEPASMLLVGAGLAALLFRRRTPAPLA